MHCFPQSFFYLSFSLLLVCHCDSGLFVVVFVFFFVFLFSPSVLCRLIKLTGLVQNVYINFVFVSVCLYGCIETEFLKRYI